MEVGGRGRLYTYRYTVTTRMTPTLRWAVMRAILVFHLDPHKLVSWLGGGGGGMLDSLELPCPSACLSVCPLVSVCVSQSYWV